MTWITRYRTRHRILSSPWYLTSYFPGYDWTWREVAEFTGCETETALRFSKELRLAGILDDSQRRLHVCHPEQLTTLLVDSHNYHALLNTYTDQISRTNRFIWVR